MLSIPKILNSALLNVSNVVRYSTSRVITPENVATHSFYVALFSLLIAKDIVAHFPKTRINYGRVLEKAIIHDLEEGVTGDVISPIKSKNKQIQKAMETLAFQAFTEAVESDIDTLKVKGDIIKSFTDYEENKWTNLENMIVKFSDILSVVSYATQEYQMGNVAFEEKINNAARKLEEFKKNERLAPYAEQATQHCRFIISKSLSHQNNDQKTA